MNAQPGDPYWPTIMLQWSDDEYPVDLIVEYITMTKDKRTMD